MKKTIKQHEEKNAKQKSADAVPEGAVPAYLLDREGQDRAKVLSNMVKQKRKEKAGKWSVPLPTVRGMAEDEMFKVIKTGKSKSKSWKRMITKATFVGDGFTRKPPKYERFIRPMAMRYKKAHVTHPELKATFHLPIIGVKKNPQSPLYTQLGVITKGSVLEVNVSELGLVTTGGKVVWGKYAQVTNNPGKNNTTKGCCSIEADDLLCRKRWLYQCCAPCLDFITFILISLLYTLSFHPLIPSFRISLFICKCSLNIQC